MTKLLIAVLVALAGAAVATAPPVAAAEQAHVRLDARWRQVAFDGARQKTAPRVQLLGVAILRLGMIARPVLSTPAPTGAVGYRLVFRVKRGAPDASVTIGDHVYAGAWPSDGGDSNTSCRAITFLDAAGALSAATRIDAALNFPATRQHLQVSGPVAAYQLGTEIPDSVAALGCSLAYQDPGPTSEGVAVAAAIPLMRALTTPRNCLSGLSDDATVRGPLTLAVRHHEVVGCWGRNARPLKIGQWGNDDGFGSGSTGAVLGASGPCVLHRTQVYSRYDSAIEESLTLADVRQGRIWKMSSQGVLAAHVLSKNCAVAWVDALGDDQPYVVRMFDAKGPRALARGTDIDPRSLVATSDGVQWKQGGKAETATFAGAPKPR